MDVGDIVSKAYLVEQGYVPLWSQHEGKHEEVHVYTHKEKGLDVKIERYYDMPDVYTVKVKVDLKQLKKDIDGRVESVKEVRNDIL